MSKRILLSTEISRCRALLAGGGSIYDIESRLKRWHLSSPQRGYDKPSPVSKRWYEILTRAIEEFKTSGYSFLKVLSSIQPLLRQEEGFYRKKQMIQKQYAFQGALGVVMPWAVAGFIENVQFNIFTLIAIVLQLVGLLGFWILFTLSLKEKPSEETWLLDFLHILLPKVAAQSSLVECLKLAIPETKKSPFKTMWINWLSFFESSASTDEFAWTDKAILSRDFSDFLTHLIRTGSPAFDSVLDYIEALSFDRSSAFEDQMASLPSKVSLVFCLCFAPSVLFIVLGSLWPMLESL